MADFQLPLKGFSAGFPISHLPPLTSGYMDNVRATDVLEKRVRVGQRPGLAKWGVGTQIGSAEQPVVAMCVVSTAV